MFLYSTPYDNRSSISYHGRFRNNVTSKKLRKHLKRHAFKLLCYSLFAVYNISSVKVYSIYISFFLYMVIFGRKLLFSFNKNDNNETKNKKMKHMNTWTMSKQTSVILH